ncbi:MAG TPA: tetratricopeptide repeat protein, partial [Verrucomicrobiae bacterium]
FTLGLMAKPMLVTLPCVFLLLDYWPMQRWSFAALPAAVWREKIPFFLLTLASSAITFVVQQKGEAVVSLTKIPLTYRLENAPLAIGRYVAHFFWPTDLTLIYPMPDQLPLAWVGASVLMLTGITGLAWTWRQTRPYFLVGWLWFLGTLVPVIGLVQVGSSALADRYTYLPSIGFFLALVLLANEFSQRIPLPRALGRIILAVLILGCITLTWKQIGYWSNGETLFRHAVELNPDNEVAWVNLGVALHNRGDDDAALTAYRQAEKVNPTRYQTHLNIGNILSSRGLHSEALAEYRQAIQIRPQQASLYLYAGQELAELGQIPEALAELGNAIKLDEHYGIPHLETGKIYFRLGREAEGVEEFRTAVRLEPDNYQVLAIVAHYLAATENDTIRDPQTALNLALKANELSNRQQPMAFDILGMSLAAKGDFTNAITCAQNALELAKAANLKHTEAIQTRLEQYQNQRPWRESFRETNVPASK